MEFFIAFANFGLAMWLGWQERSTAALYVFAAGLIFAAALFMRHATAELPLSF